jgi:hypothetical protein
VAALLATAGIAHAEPEPAPTEPPPAQSFADEPAAEEARPPPAEARKDALDPPVPEDVQSFAAATMKATHLRFALNAFGDASAAVDVPAEGDGRGAFSLGTFALLINGQLSQPLLATAEVAFDGTDKNEQAVTLERLHLRWQTPRFYVVGGRTHSDLGYWNTAFHHGAWLHLPIGRPRALLGEVNGGILPIHWIGVEGGIVIAGALTLAGGVGNGRGQTEEDIRISNDTNQFKALKAKVEYRGLGWRDLRVGIGGLYDRIAAEPMNVRPALPGKHIDELIGNVYAAYRGLELTLIAEAYSIWHRASGDTFTTMDEFVVVGYRIGRITPYLLVERTDARGGIDPFYTPVPGMPTTSTPVDGTDVLVGARLDTSVWSALKAEYRASRVDGGDGLDHEVALNWSFGI